MALIRFGCRTSRVIALFVISACSSFDPLPLEEVGFLERSQTQIQGKVSLTAAVPSAEECVQAFGVNLTLCDFVIACFPNEEAQPPDAPAGPDGGAGGPLSG